MSKSPRIEATKRTVLGKKVRSLRREGIVPANVYGNGVESTAIQLNGREFNRVFPQISNSTLIDLSIGKEKSFKTFLKAYQFNAVTGSITHADFFIVNMLERMKIEVAVVLTGEAPDSNNSLISQHLSSISVEALPGDLPSSFSVDISDLKEVGDAILVKDLVMPEGVTLLTDAEEIVVSAIASQKVEAGTGAEADAEAAAEAESGESGEAASEPAAE